MRNCWHVASIPINALRCLLQKDKNRTTASSNKGDRIPAQVPKPVPSSAGRYHNIISNCHYRVCNTANVIISNK